MLSIPNATRTNVVISIGKWYDSVVAEKSLPFNFLESLSSAIELDTPTLMNLNVYNYEDYDCFMIFHNDTVIINWNDREKWNMYVEHVSFEYLAYELLTDIQSNIDAWNDLSCPEDYNPEDNKNWLLSLCSQLEAVCETAYPDTGIGTKPARSRSYRRKQDFKKKAKVRKVTPYSCTYFLDGDGCVKKRNDSNRTKYYKNQSNRKIRRYKGELPKGNAHRKLYEYWWMVD